MTRRAGWASKNTSLYERRRSGGPGRTVFTVAVVLALLVVGYLLFTRACGGSGCDKLYCETDRDIPPPEGFQLVSKLYGYNKAKGQVPAGTDIQVQLPLSKQTTDARNLSFYRYVEVSRTWEPLTAAVLDAQGKTVAAAFSDTPLLMAVMRRLSPAGNVVAYLEKNQALNKQASGRVTMVHTLDFRPGSAGEMDGDLSQAKFDANIAHYPSIVATATDGGMKTVAGILSNAQSRSSHVAQVVKKANDLKLPGVDVMYLDLPADQRTSFTLFIEELAAGLRAQGKVLTLTLPSPQKAADRIDEGAYDWGALGKLGEVLQISPYRDQSTYRLAMPEILAYLAARVDAAKLVLTVTPYATEKSQDGVRRISLIEAMNIATQLQLRSRDKITTNSNVEIAGVNIDRDENLTGLKWDPAAAAVAFTFKLNGGRTIWIENFFSVGFKLEFVTRFKLGGVAVEDASDNIYIGDIWPALLPFVTSGQPILMQPNSEDLKPKWKASKGTLEGGQRGVVKWTTPAEPGDQTINLTLSDGVYVFESEIRITVAARDPRSPTASATP